MNQTPSIIYKSWSITTDLQNKYKGKSNKVFLQNFRGKFVEICRHLNINVLF